MSTPPPHPKDALRTAIAHIEHMAAWISARNSNIAYEGASTYSFESLGEDMPGIKAALKDEQETYEIGVRDGYESAVQDFDLATGGDGEFKGSTIPGGTVDVRAMKERTLARILTLTAEEFEHIKEAFVRFAPDSDLHTEISATILNKLVKATA